MRRRIAALDILRIPSIIPGIFNRRC